jgi:hypothetical protein
MLTPVEAQDFLLATAAGGVVVLAGAGYAGLFALARLHRRPGLMPAAYLAYAILAAAVLVLARAAHFSGFWTFVAALMLAGYLLAPHGVWRLCVGTHPHEPHDPPGQSGAKGP